MDYRIQKLGVTGHSFQPVNPYEITYKQCLEVAEMMLSCFQGTPFTAYRLGEKNAYGNDLAEARKLLDVDQRLESFIYRAKTYKKLTHCLARFWHLGVIKRRHQWACFFVKDDNERIIGFVNWNAAYMNLPIPEISFIKKMWYSVYVTYLDWKYWLLTLWDFPTEHPFSNKRMEAVMKVGSAELVARHGETRSQEDLAKCSTEELANAVYPDEQYLYLNALLVDPNYQRQGIGKAAYNQSLELVPRSGPEFKGDNCSSTGPQKLCLHSSPEGYGLYKSLGFVDDYNAPFGNDGLRIIRMSMIRP